MEMYHGPSCIVSFYIIFLLPNLLSAHGIHKLQHSGESYRQGEIFIYRLHYELTHLTSSSSPFIIIISVIPSVIPTQCTPHSPFRALACLPKDSLADIGSTGFGV